MKIGIVIATCSIAAAAAASPQESCTGTTPVFGELRRVPGADGAIPLLPLSSADVDGDGDIDFFQDRGVGTFYYLNGEPFCCTSDVMSDVLVRSTFTRASGTVEHNWCSLLENAVAWGRAETWVASNYTGIRDAYALGLGDPASPYTGWRDCDMDGDLDLVITIRIVLMNGWTSNVPVYFENIGLERTNPITADLNGDGVVDGKDLATVLAQWTGN